MDLEHPTYLDFEYVQAFADVLDTLPAGPLAVTHVGGGGCTLARYLAATRPGSSQIVLKPDTAVVQTVRGPGCRCRAGPGSASARSRNGRSGVAQLRDASADVLVLDAFHGGRVPGELATAEFLADVGRVLRPDGVFLANVADGPPTTWTRRLVTTVRTVLPELLVIADPAVLKSRRFGNVVLAASRVPLPVDDVRRSAARAAFPRTVTVGFGGDDRPFTDDDATRLSSSARTKGGASVADPQGE